MTDPARTLRHYAQHFSDCQAHWSRYYHGAKCTCGLAALLVSPSRLNDDLRQLVEQWRRNADMLAEGNKAEGFCEGAGMQRACADQLDQLLASRREEEQKSFRHLRDGVMLPCTLPELLGDAARFAIRSDVASWYVGALAEAIRILTNNQVGYHGAVPVSEAGSPTQSEALKTYSQPETVHRIMKRFSELPNEEVGDETLTISHDELQRILHEEIS